MCHAALSFGLDRKLKRAKWQPGGTNQTRKLSFTRGQMRDGVAGIIPHKLYAGFAWRRRPSLMRIGFLFNHDQIHQIAHSLPIALALAKSGIDAEILIATTSVNVATEIIRLLGPKRPAGILLIGLGLRSGASRLAAGALGRFIPAAKLLVYRENLDFFRSLDALIVTERTSLILKTRYGLKRPLMILSDHGAGDRAIGFGASAAQFDHILAAGPKIVERLVNEAGVKPERMTITGYPKFDFAPVKPRVLPFTGNGRPTILYNPHVSPHLSSWYKQGRAVLDFFVGNPDYNLIFAPHIMLFQRRVVMTIDRLSLGFPGLLHPKYAAANNIHIDLGSPALTDMSYTNMADIYVGDVSSQIYEFLKTPRPCMFLNTHGIRHEGDPNYAHWQSGPVIHSVAELGVGLAATVSDHPAHYKAIQQRLFANTFDLDQMPSSMRAAAAIVRLLEGKGRSLSSLASRRFRPLLKA